MNGIHEVTGSIPVWSTILRSRELTPKRERRLGEPREGGPLRTPTRRSSAVAYEPPSRFVDGGTMFFIRK